ncbi:hypothetical protein HZH66_013794 [Vespula vulgaris]|uniref:Uncharacterized protein n=1 Tax=Vespula vulgaris TaxID=7454 RepID=A0A834J4L3_VESVU|nr:hypothetical protein HZH66_013794 [Vespula vulgaris]
MCKRKGRQWRTVGCKFDGCISPWPTEDLERFCVVFMRVSRVCNRSKGYRVERNSASEPGPHWRYVAGPPDPFLYFRNPRQHDHPGYPP